MLGFLVTMAWGAPERVQVGNLVTEGVPEVPATVRERLRQYQNARSASLVDFDASGGSVLVTTRFGETTQLHRVASPGAARTQLTFFDEPVYTVVPSPTDRDRVLLLRDVGGSEEYQVVLLDLASGRTTTLSSGSGRCGDPVWSSDGRQVAWIQSDPEGTTRRAFTMDPADPASRTERWKGEGAWSVADWFPGDDRLMLFQYVAADDGSIHELTLATGAVRQLNPSKKKISYHDVALAPDGQSVYVVSDMGEDRAGLWRMSTGKKAKPELLSKGVDAEVEDVVLSDDGALLAFTTNEDGRSRLMLKRVDGWSDVPVPDLPPGVLYGVDFDPSGQNVGLTLNRAAAPGDVYTFAVGQTSLVRWTSSEVGGLDPATFVEPEMFRYPAKDGLQIPAFVYRPRGEGPHPVLINIHGGPEGQSRPYFSSSTQFWVNELGIAVVYPNVRGSVGFGRAYHQADNGLKRKDSVADIGSLLDWIGTQDDLDAGRVAVIGGSYGGYMVLASLEDYADRLVGGVDIVGVSDFKTFLANTKDYRRDLRRVEYGDERDPKIAAFFDAISPLKHADRIQDPLFVVQGANDPRVPASEAEQIVAAVRASGQEAWYMLALDEGHGFRKKANSDAMAEAIVLFLESIYGGTP
ncbi:MAG: S9 family peptidase [Alphaproteobacteria bacterium]|nr:S9 family peptidase [Alphaproteobacteria bacterium]